MPRRRRATFNDDGTPALILLDVEASQIWDERERATVQQAALDIGAAIARDIQRVAEQTRRISNLLVEPSAEIQPAPALAPAEAFLKVFGNSIRSLRKDIPADGSHWGETRTRNLVWVFRNAPHSFPGDAPAAVGNRPEFSVHEMGHVFENVIQAAIGTKKGRNSIPSAQLSRPKGFFQRGRFQQSQGLGRGEIFADMFIGWVYDRWETSDGQPGSPLKTMGEARKQFMDSIMIELIEIAMGFNRNR